MVGEGGRDGADVSDEIDVSDVAYKFYISYISYVRGLEEILERVGWNGKYDLTLQAGGKPGMFLLKFLRL